MKGKKGTSMVVQEFRLFASIAGGKGSIPGQETKIPRAAQGPPRPPPNPTNQIKANNKNNKMVQCKNNIRH